MIGNNLISNIDLFGLVAIMDCTRFEWNGRFGQVCHILEFAPCSSECCKAEAEKLKKAKSKSAALAAGKEFFECLKKRNEGDAKVTSHGPIFTNLWDNHASDTAGDPHGFLGPIPSDNIYRVLPKPGPSTKKTDIVGSDGIDFHTGTPSVTGLNQSQPGVLYSNKGKRRSGVRIHYPTTSHGCPTCNVGTSNVQGERFKEGMDGEFGYLQLYYSEARRNY